MTTKDLAKRTKTQLLVMVDELLSEKVRLQTALKNRYFEIDYPAKKCVALPLTDAERRAVDDFARDSASCYATEGRLQSPKSECSAAVYDLPIGWKYDALLPQFSGLVIRYSYDELEAGTDVFCVWGLLAI